MGLAPPDGAPQMCIACGCAPRRRYWLAGGRVRFLQCPRCLLGWWDWPPHDPGAFYDEHYFQSAEDSKGYDDYAALEPGIARTARSRLKRIEQVSQCSLAIGACTGAPRLLELGCGPGVFLAEAQRAGWQIQGVEISAYAAERARERGFDVHTGAVEGRVLPRAAYNCVALWDVLEHLRDPAGVLAAASRALRPGGVLALSTGDVTSLCARLSGPGWHLFNIPEHLFFFSPAALRTLLRRVGCRIVAVQREVNWVPATYLVERLRKSRGALRCVARFAARGASVLMGDLGRYVVPATLADVLGVYAVREQ